jgi:hypothetical protein
MPEHDDWLEAILYSLFSLTGGDLQPTSAQRLPQGAMMKDFYDVKTGDILERKGGDGGHFIIRVTGNRHGDIEATILQVYSEGNMVGDVKVGGDWTASEAFAEYYTRLDHLPVEYNVNHNGNPAEPAGHIMGLSPEEIDKDAYREFMKGL